MCSSCLCEVGICIQNICGRSITFLCVTMAMYFESIAGYRTTTIYMRI